MREANAELDRVGERVPAAAADAALDALASIDGVFGVLALADGEEETAPKGLQRWVEERLAERAAARAAKDYARADAIRAELAEKGVEVEDTAAGSRWRLAR